MSAMLHTHQFKGVTTYVDGHLHFWSGVTSASPNVPGHTHIVAGETTVNDGHSHSYSLRTYPPTYVDQGHYKHYHYYEGDTHTTLDHHHHMSETTFVLGE